MKIDAKVRFIRARCIFNHDSLPLSIAHGQVETIVIDLDYIDDYDDVLQSIEEQLWKTYRVALCNEVDYVVENAPEICEAISL